MRTIVLALVCVAAVLLGTWLGQRGDVVVLPATLVAAALIGAGAWLVAGQGRDRAETVALAGLLVCAGLLRGASGAASASLRVDERGIGSGSGVELREFMVVGASEPGPRCRLQLRDPRARWPSPGLTVEAPPEVCPRSHGQRIAVSARALRPGWREALLERDEIELGRGPVVWTRPAVPRTRLERLVDRYWERVADLRQRAWVATRGDPQASLVVAAALGLRAALEPGERRELRAAGLGHLIAVSGLHVALAAIWFSALARRVATLLDLSPHVASVGAWIPLWIYVGLTGGAPSAIRAAAMLTTLELGAVVGRPSHGPTLLAVVAAGMLLARPSWVLDPGFGLSVAAMAAIVSAERDAGVLALSWRISWATAPLSLLYFDHAPLHGLVGNLVALPLFGVMMPLGLVASLTTGGVAELAMTGARWFADPILALASVLSAVPSFGADALAFVALLLRGLGWCLGRAQAVEGAGSSEANSGRLRPRWMDWLPPQLACWAVVALALALHVRQPPAPPAGPAFDWLALGTPRSYAVLTATEDRPRAACLYRPTGGVAVWRALLGELGVARLAWLDAELPPQPGEAAAQLEAGDAGARQPRSDPRTRALATRLREAGVIVEHPRASACPPVDRSSLRGALAACRFIQGGPHRALVRSRRGRVECRIEQRWVSVEP